MSGDGSKLKEFQHVEYLKTLRTPTFTNGSHQMASHSDFFKSNLEHERMREEDRFGKRTNLQKKINLIHHSGCIIGQREESASQIISLMKMSPFHIIRTLFILIGYLLRPLLIFVLQSASNHFRICVIKDSEENRLVGKFGLNLVWWKCMNF